MIKLPCSVILLITALITGSSAIAQYVWLNENGQKQYSDHAPPASVPKDRILKSSDPMQEDKRRSDSKTDEKIISSKSLADRELAYKKRRDELAEKEKKDTANANAEAIQVENCRRMKEYKMGLESGQRYLQMNANGATGYMSDEKRKEELNDVQQKLGECS